jgi:hypothetical protein
VKIIVQLPGDVINQDGSSSSSVVRSSYRSECFLASLHAKLKGSTMMRWISRKLQAYITLPCINIIYSSVH